MNHTFRIRLRHTLLLLSLCLWAGPALAQTEIVAWGDNSNGQATVPPGLTDIIQISAGGGHSVALTSDGAVTAWGLDADGQATVPIGLANVMGVAAGNRHTLALMDDGTVLAWGFNGDGQTDVPPGLTNVVQIAAGGVHSAALRADGSVVFWGDPFAGQCCPVPTNAAQVATGFEHSITLYVDGTINTQTNRFIDWMIRDMEDVVQVSAGHFLNVALTTDGTVEAWGVPGLEYQGQFDVPPDLSKVIQVDAGHLHVLALKEDGTVEAWGSNSAGQADVPPALSDVLQVSAGGSHSLALRQAEVSDEDVFSQIATLRDAIRDLSDRNLLGHGNANALDAKLDAAVKHLGDGRATPAANVIGAFINQVKSFKKTGRLPDAEASHLIELAEAILEGIEGMDPSEHSTADRGRHGSGHGRVITLHGNHPNPFNPSTEINFELSESVHVRVTVVNVIGQEVARLSDAVREAGMHRVTWDAARAPSGVYLYRVEAGDFVEAGRMLLVK